MRGVYTDDGKHSHGLEGYVIARLKKAGETFEVWVDPDLVEKYLQGKIELDEILGDEDIYKDAYKGLRAGKEELEKAFGDLEKEKIIEKIIKEGEIQLTTEQRNRMLENKKKQIIAYLVKNCIDPQTKMPHTPTRIEEAMKKAKVHIDIFKPVEVQAKEILDKLKPIIPIKIELSKIEVSIPLEYANKSYGFIKKYKPTKENWGDTFKAELIIPTASLSDFIEELNRYTHGESNVEILERFDI